MKKSKLLAVFMFTASIFNMVPPASATHSGVVTSFTLISIDTDQPVPGFDPIPNNAVLNLITLPTTRLNIRANTTGTTQSVRFGYDANANYRTENVAPYALAGDNNSDYYVWTPTLGSHTVTARPYSADNAGGSAGALVSLTFTVENTAQLDSSSVYTSSGGTTTSICPGNAPVQCVVCGQYQDECIQSCVGGFRCDITVTQYSGGWTSFVCVAVNAPKCISK